MYFLSMYSVEMKGMSVVIKHLPVVQATYATRLKKLLSTISNAGRDSHVPGRKVSLGQFHTIFAAVTIK
jgi:hypothetical protein